MPLRQEIAELRAELAFFPKARPPKAPADAQQGLVQDGAKA